MFKCLTYLFLQQLAGVAVAQSLNTTTYAAKDGLLDDRVTAITKDHRQLLWIGTPFGLNWFDGNSFYAPPITARTGQLYITSFYKDNSGTVWTLTFYNGIYKFDKGKFTNFLPQPHQLTSNRNNVFSMLQVDSFNYLVGTDENVFWFNGSSFTHFDKANHLLNTQLNCLGKTGSVILLGTDKYLWQYELSNKTITNRRIILEDHKVYNISVQAEDIWVATNKGLYRYKNYGTINTQSPQLYLAGHNVVSTTKGKDGLWITAENLYHLKNGALTIYDESNGLPYSSAGVFYDSEGITWFTTPKGLSRLEKNYYQTLDLRGSKAHPMIICLEKNNDELWLGSYAGLTKVQEKKLLTLNEHKGKKLNYISWIRKLKNGSLLAGTEAGVLQITGNTLQKKYDIVSTKAFEDSSGNLWLGTIHGRLFKINSNTIQEINLVGSIPDFIDAICKDKSGFLWIGYRNNGIIKFKENGITAHAVKSYNETNGFPDLRIRCGISDNKGNIIVGTRTNGMFIFSSTDDTYQHITKKHGLTGNWVKSLSIDHNENIYAATNKGLNVLQINNKQPAVRQLQLSATNLEAPVNFVLAEKDTVWVGTDSGLVKYLPRLDLKDTTHPGIYLTELSINGKNDSALIPYSPLAVDYTLAHNRNVIALRFSGVDMHGGNLRYSYRLKGQDNNWSEADSRNFVSYNLPPGKYEFQVYSISNSGIKSVYPASLSFTILAPFWKTTWFFLGCIVVALLTIYFIYRNRIAQVVHIEKMRGRISADLHDDLGSGLSRIKFLSETIKLNNRENVDLEKDLSKISVYADEMAEKIGEIVWALNNKNDKLRDLIAYIRSYTMEFLTNQGISCTAETPAVIPDIMIDGETRRNIFLSVKEVLVNIVKHAGADKVSLDIIIQGSLQVIIHDNGAGIDLQNLRKFGNGLANISTRMRQSRGSATFTKQIGTKVMLDVPLHI